MYWLKNVHKQIRWGAVLAPQLDEIDSPIDKVLRDRAVMTEVRSTVERSGEVLDAALARMNAIYLRDRASQEEERARAKDWYDAFLSFLILLDGRDLDGWLAFGKIMEDDLWQESLAFDADRSNPLSVSEWTERDDAAALALCGLMDDLRSSVGYGLERSTPSNSPYLHATVETYAGLEAGRRSRWPHRNRLVAIATPLAKWLGDPTADRIEAVVAASASMIDALQDELRSRPRA